MINRLKEVILFRDIRVRCVKILIAALFVAAFLSDAPVLQGKGIPFERVPDALVFFEPGQNPEYAVVVEKKTQTLFLYFFDGEYRQVYSTACSTGEVAGPKMLAGDKRTPEGIYFFTKEHPKRDLSPVYGSRAFPIDYPNLLDRIADRGGNAIWMHGTNKPLNPTESNGCIVLRNKDIDKLAKHITLNRTPMIVVDRLSYISRDARTGIRKSLLSFLEKWGLAITSGTYHEYLSRYHADYVPDITWWSDWIKTRRVLGKKGVSISIAIKRRSIFKHGSVYTVLFDQVIRSPEREVYAGTRKLFLSNENGSFRIIGEEYQVLPTVPKKWEHASPLVALSQNFESMVKESQPVEKTLRSKKKETATKALDDKREIISMIDRWLKAWSSKDIKRYGSYYAKDFRSQGGADMETWLSYKDSLNKKYNFINISRKGVKIKRGKKLLTASFIQTYVSDQYKAVGVKRLTLKREGNQWKIFREGWKRI